MATTEIWISIVLTLTSFFSQTTSVHFEDVPGVESMHQKENDARADARCVLCKFVMEEIDNWLTGPVVKEFLKEEFMPKCKKYVPFAAERVCHAIVDAMDDALNELVYSEMAPNTACARVKMCGKESGNVREPNSVKMPHSSENFLCGLCKEMTKSATELSAVVLEDVYKEVTEVCQHSELRNDKKCDQLIHELVHDIQEKVQAGPLSHQNMCIDSLKVC